MLEDDPSFEANLDDVLNRWPSRGSWVQRFAVLAVTLLVGAVVLAATIGRGTAPTAAEAMTGRYNVFLSSDVTWGTYTITVGGRRQTILSTGVAQSSFIFTAPAQLEIALSAPPFATTTCHLSLPPALRDTCRGAVGDAQSQTTPSGLTRLNVFFDLTLADLPTTMSGTITQAIMPNFWGMMPQVAIASGGHYAIGGLLTSDYMASMPLTATLHTAFGARNLIPDQQCLVICGVTGTITREPSLRIWHARIFVDQHWQIARRADGVSLGSIAESIVPRPLDIDLQFDPLSNQWSIAPTVRASTVDVLSAGMCADGEVALQSLYFVPNSRLSDFATTPQDDDYHINGCLLHLRSMNGGGTADFLWRLGRLYAVNATAHFVAGNLPVASLTDLAALA